VDLLVEAGVGDRMQHEGSVHDLETDRPRIRFAHEGADEVLECDVIAGCDGFHGVCRPSSNRIRGEARRVLGRHMLHRVESDDDFGLELQLSQLRYVTTSEAAATSLAENYVGLESL
jgi:2-polyprenyl-6-methoxyphenol hydroxylase-like FAD-dependent oxidoreductase